MNPDDEDKIYRKYDYLHAVIFVFWAIVFSLLKMPSDLFGFFAILLLSLMCWMPTAAIIFGHLIRSEQLKMFGYVSTVLYIIYFINNFEI